MSIENNPTYEISTFNGQQQHEMKYVDQVRALTSDGLADVVCKKAWSPFTFDNDKSGKPHRHSDCFKGTNLLVYDEDEGMSLDQTIAVVKDLDLKALIGTTRNHQRPKQAGKKIKPACDRCRIIIPLERTITSKSEYLATWNFHAKKFSIDASCKDTARFYFPCKEIVYKSDGKLIEVCQPTQESLKPVEKTPQVKYQNSAEIPDHRGRLFQSTVAFIENGVEEDWHMAIFKATADLKEQGYSRKEAANLLRRGTKNYDGDLDDHDWQVINDVYQNRGGKYEKRSKAKDDFSDDSTETPEWPAPETLPCGLPIAPGMKSEEIPEPIRPWAMDVAVRMNVPLEMVTLPFFTSLGHVIGSRISVQPKQYDESWTELLNFWNVNIASPSMLKSPTRAESMAFMNSLENKNHAKYAKELDRMQPELIKLAAELKINQKLIEKEGAPTAEIAVQIDLLQKEIEAKTPKLKRMTTNDPTTEKLGMILAEPQTDGMLIDRDELAGFLHALGKQGREGDRQFYLESWSGKNSYTYDRVGRGTIHIQKHKIAICGGTQPSVFAEIRKSHAHDGWDDRFQLACFPETTPARPVVDRAPNWAAKKRVGDIFEFLSEADFTAQLGTGGRKGPRLGFCPKAQTLFNEWLEAHEVRLRHPDVTDTPLFASHLGKYRGLMPQLALLFHLIDWGDRCSNISFGSGFSTDLSPIPVEATRMAINFCIFLEAHAKKIHSISEEPGAVAALALSKKIKNGEIKDKDSIRTVNRHQWTKLSKIADVEAGILVLEKYKWVKIQNKNEGSFCRPSEIIRINPRLKNNI